MNTKPLNSNLQAAEKRNSPKPLAEHRRRAFAFRKSALGLFLLSAAAIVALTGCSPPAADTTSTKDPTAYPNKTITLVCPWSPGGGTDRMSRMMARELKEELGQPVVVVNKTGGGGAIGHSAGANAKPDGYTLTMTTFELSTMHWMGISDLTWENFQPLYLLNGDAAAFIVKEDSDIKSLDNLIARIKEKPKTIKMSGTASGGAWDLARAGFLMKAGLPVDSVIWVPTQGSAPAIVQLLGGHIDIICCSLPEAAAQLEGGKLRALAVMAPERAPGFADVPTVKELGIDWEAVGWRGLCVPKGTPDDAIKVLTETCEKLVASVPFMKFMAQNRFAALKGNPVDFGEFLKEQDARWKPVIEATGFAAQ